MSKAEDVTRNERAEGQRVLLLGSFAPSLIGFRGPLLAELVRRGHEVFAACPQIDEHTAHHVRALGATPVEVPVGRGSLNPIRALRSIRAMKAEFLRLSPDVIIAYTIMPVVFGAIAAKSAGVGRFVAMITGLGYAFTGGREPKRLLSRMVAQFLYRRAFRVADIAIFQNDDDRQEFRRLRLLRPELPTALTNGSGVDTQYYTPAPLPGTFTFLMIARLLKDKGLREFGAAARALKIKYPHVRIALAGWLDATPDSISQSELDAMIAGGIEYLGHLEDVRPAIAAASVYVLPSYREGTPRSVLEAMAMGRAIITTDAPGCRETVVPNENGFLVEPRSADALLAAMRRFVDEPELALAMGVASRYIAESKYDVREVNDELIRHAQL